MKILKSTTEYAQICLDMGFSAFNDDDCQQIHDSLRAFKARKDYIDDVLEDMRHIEYHNQ